MARTSGMSDEEYHSQCEEIMARQRRDREWRRLHPYYGQYCGRDCRAPNFRLGETVYWRGLVKGGDPFSKPVYEGTVIGLPLQPGSALDNDIHLGRYIVLPKMDYYEVGRTAAEFFFNDELAKKSDDVVHHPTIGDYYPGMDANITSE